MSGPEAALRDAGLRVTRQRLAVLSLLRGRNDAVTALEVHQELRARGKPGGLATVYRTLAALSEAGELDAIPRGGEQAFRMCGGDHHHHLVCTSCGKVDEVGSEEVEAWVVRVARRRGFKVSRHTADIYGTCRRCS